LTNVGVSNRPELVNNVDSTAPANSYALLLTEQSVAIIHDLLNGIPLKDSQAAGLSKTPERTAGVLLQRLENESVRITSISLRKCNNDELVQENVLSEEPTEIKRTRSVIKSEILLSIFLDACTSHPRIEVRSRAVVSALHSSTSRAPPTQGEARNSSDTVDFDNETLQTGQSGGDYGVLHGLGRMARLAASGHPRRSFIYLGDEGGHSTSTINLLDKLTMELDKSLRVASSSADSGSGWQERRSPGQDSPVSLKDMQFDRGHPQVIKNSEAMLQTTPVVVLTSGEMIVADAVLGSSSAPSKVIDFVNSSSRNRWRPISSSSSAAWSDPQQGYEVYRAHIVLDRTMADSELQPFTENSNVTIWANTEIQFVFSPLGRATYEVCIWRRANELPASPAVVANSGGGAAQQMRQLVDGWCDQVVKIASHISSASHSLVCEQLFIDTWSNESHNAVLIGDAAHSLLPYGHTRTGAALDDAATLGALFSTFPLSSAHQSAFKSKATDVSDIIQSYVSLRMPLHESIHDALGEGLFYPDIISSVYNRVIWSHVGILSGQVSGNDAWASDDPFAEGVESSETDQRNTRN